MGRERAKKKQAGAASKAFRPGLYLPCEKCGAAIGPLTLAAMEAHDGICAECKRKAAGKHGQGES